ncbi:Putative cytosolic protein (plasmid) [Borrelia nietonii YOR]|uniref:Putative cytosolic protein n=2 Tax=Borrelia TaxID=138 RepID=W5SBT3_9SPIR|nr:DUF226 domain-containing protein [Borrelia nietonii]AHH04355.1 Putative cytosolic protein [Borrelia nietonii YOR]UPA09593.1 DUF226 domain-containing protein [Borrelia nietonii YOR]
MESVLERLKKKELAIKDKRNKTIFVKIEEINNRKIYHTKVMTDFYAFGINKKKNRFFILLRKLFNRDKINEFHLFSLKDDDKFLGIYYGYRKPIKNIITRYEENGIIKTISFSKVYYIEFRFKKGSVFCYLRGISYLLRKEKSHKKYCESLVERIINLEKQVYEFYGKKLPDGGFINKWIEKNLR